MAEGDTVNDVPVKAPGFKVYVDAPPGVITTGLPEQIVLLETDVMETVGNAFTTINCVAVFADKQPVALTPAMLYVVLVDGLTVNIVPVNAPGFKV